MIEGMKLDFTTEQLKKHCATRIAYHEKRAVFFADEAKRFADDAREADLVSNRGYTAGKGDLLARAENNKKMAAYFKIVSDHLVPGETYRLSDSELSRLELTSD